ncbi:MAG: hypothetical protein B7X57_10130, partial [Erythrobacter sp. 34-65-8]
QDAAKAFPKEFWRAVCEAGLCGAALPTEVGGADLAATISRLQQVMTTLEASQASYARLASLSLFDRL